MKVFIAGPRAVKTLNTTVKDALSRMIEKQRIILLGDAAGVDRLVQEYFADAEYPNVYIYASNGKARNNIGGWPVLNVEAPPKAKGFNFYVQKDIQMAQDADNGFMIWNGKSRGTLNNIINLVTLNKMVIVYLTHAKRMFCIENLNNVRNMAQFMGPETLALYHELCPTASTSSVQADLKQLSLSDLDD